MSNIVSAFISPHPPIILPSVGSKEDREKVKTTIESLYVLSKELKKTNPQQIVISSPHPDWGFEVPLYFLANNFQGKIDMVLTGSESPEFYFNEGKRIYKNLAEDKKYALIASGDLSHCLKEDGPYGLNPQGGKFDKELIESLKKKDIENILKLDNKYPEAGECGLRSICFLLGMLEANSTRASTELSRMSSGQVWQPEILSYEFPFGVGYLVANFKLK
ncbi:MAG: AmmeMemoRadiSam system protein B [Candidatus Pacebacteria bacterium]|nr:AmmeMemoRadiSam system protein B [Candidatus Paceibacterota bacterium]